MVDLAFLMAFEEYLGNSANFETGTARRFKQQFQKNINKFELIAEMVDDQGRSIFIGPSSCFTDKYLQNPYKEGRTIKECLDSEWIFESRKSTNQIEIGSWVAIGFFTSNYETNTMQSDDIICTISYTGKSYLLTIQTMIDGVLKTGHLLSATREAAETARRNIHRGLWKIEIDEYGFTMVKGYNALITLSESVVSEDKK